MKRFITIYYLLFVLLILGAFASMAQNDYGNTILGGVAIAFAALFGFQSFTSFSHKENSERIDRLELLSLTILAGILSLRVFYIHFQWVETIYGFAGLLLIVVQFRKLLANWQWYSAHNKTLAYLTIIFRASIILYLFSMTIVPFVYMLSEPAGEAAFALMIVFVTASYMRRGLMINGERVSGFKAVIEWKDHSLMLMALFLLFTAYMGLTKVNAIPKMYSDELPQAYFELVKQVEGQKSLNSTTKPEAFKKAYEQFVENSLRDRK